MKNLLSKFMSLRVSLLSIMLMCWLIPTICLGTFMGTRFFRVIQEKTEASLTSGAEQAHANTLNNIANVISLAKSAVYDGELAEAVSSFTSGKITHEAYFRLCRGYLERKYGREALCDFALFYCVSDPANIFYTSDAYQEVVFFSQNVQPSILARSEALGTGCLFYAQDDRTYLVRNLYNSQLELYGMLLLGINTHRLFAPIDAWIAQWDAAHSLSLDTYHTGDMAYMERVDGLSEDSGLLLYTLSDENRDYRFRFQVQADKSKVYHEMEVFGQLLVGLFVLMVPLCLLTMYFVNRRIIQPIEILSEASARIQRGELGITVPLHGPDELGRLGNAFSNMSIQLKTLVDKSYKEEIALRDARIQAMQSRINPHFLNNALETINWQARMEDSETISAMVEALSLLLNASMDRGEQHLVPLQEELTIADAYFYFVGLRFGERLSVFKSIQEGIQHYLIPRLVIQTLLENAIEHGIGPAGGGKISIRIFVKDDHLVLELTNDGKPLTEEDQSRIAQMLEIEAGATGHMGVSNVAQRLRLLYGDNAFLTIGSQANGDTLVTLSIPAQVEAGLEKPTPSKEKLDDRSEHQ